MEQAESTGEKYHRVQFDFSPESFEELVGLKLALGLKTKADVIRYAMRVLQWMVDQAKSGNRGLVEKNGVLQEVLFPFLPSVKSDEKARQYASAKAEQEYAIKKAGELRERAEDLIERSKEIMSRQKESLSSAVEAGKEAYQREKAQKQH
jgi:hypothetical protein